VTSLLGRLLQPFSDGLPLEDLFTEADVQLLETRRNRPVRFVLDALVELGEHADDEGTRVLFNPSTTTTTTC
jgi:hypothetical protein